MNIEASGRGFVHVERVGAKSIVTRVRSRSPLRLLTPRGPTESAWVFTSTLGGGLLADDQIELHVAVDRSPTCLLSTQSQTKVYRSTPRQSAIQRLSARLSDGATLVSLPDAVTCFSGSAFEQGQRFEMSESASLLWLDWLTSGRRARGERWAFRSYDSRTDVLIGDKLVFRDSMRLDASDGPIDGEHRMGRCDCFATVLLIGPRFATAVTDLLGWASSQPAVGGETVLFAASPVAGGAVLRAAGATTEAVGQSLRRRLDILPAVLGGNPWERKW